MTIVEVLDVEYADVIHRISILVTHKIVDEVILIYEKHRIECHSLITVRNFIDFSKLAIFSLLHYDNLIYRGIQVLFIGDTCVMKA